MNAFFSRHHRGRQAGHAGFPHGSVQHPHGRTLLAELALGFTPYLLVLVAVLLVGR